MLPVSTEHDRNGEYRCTGHLPRQAGKEVSGEKGLTEQQSDGAKGLNDGDIAAEHLETGDAVTELSAEPYRRMWRNQAYKAYRLLRTYRRSEYYLPGRNQVSWNIQSTSLPLQH
jgi:hypothetical protein